MRKVLVVDDELIQRDGLAKMIRKVRPLYEVIEAKNGREALNIVISGTIDIVITDVKMPIMDGLKFIEEMHGNSTAKIIIISGYRQFEYAQKALRLGATDYLLKPVREDSIIKTLEKVETSIEQDAIKNREKESLIKQLDSTLPVYFEHIMNNWVSGNITEAELNEIKHIFSFSSSGSVIAVNINKFETLTMNCESSYINEIKNNMKFSIKKALESLGHSISFFLEDRKDTMVTVFTTGNGPNLLLDNHAEKFGFFSQGMKELYEIDVSIGISPACRDIFSRIKDLLNDALLALSLNSFYQTEKVIFYPHIKDSIRTKYFDISKDEQTLKEAVRQIKSDTFASTVDDIFKRIHEGGYPIPGQLIHAVIRMTLNIASTVKEFVDEDYYYSMLGDIEKQLNECEELQEVKSKFIYFLTFFSNIIENAKVKKHELIIQKCLQYIQEHYMEDISLESVANEFYFSSCYFSVVFKNYTGITFSKHLFQLRLKKALELLDKSDFKVYEIASKVGYKDDKYFYRVFKKEFGVTPDEYRRVL